jgi:hypothetical protein
MMPPGVPPIALFRTFARNLTMTTHLCTVPVRVRMGRSRRDLR